MNRLFISAAIASYTLFSANTEPTATTKRVSMPNAAAKKAISESYKIHQRAQIMRLAEKELLVAQNAAREKYLEHQAGKSMHLPLCDRGFSPSLWQYAQDGRGDLSLFYVGPQQLTPRLLSWGEGSWVRLPKSRDFRMKCGYADRNSLSNYIEMTLDDSHLLEVRQDISSETDPELYKNAFIHLKAIAPEGRKKVAAHAAIDMMAQPAWPAGMVIFDLWERKGDMWRQVASSSPALRNWASRASRVKLSAEVGSGSEIRLTARLSNSAKQLVKQKQALGNVRIYGVKIDFNE